MLGGGGGGGGLQLVKFFLQWIQISNNFFFGRRVGVRGGGRGEGGKVNEFFPQRIQI